MYRITIKYKKSKRRNIMKVVSLFSGAGGMDLGFKQAGFDIIWANDFVDDAVETYKNNIGKHIILGDITKISSKEIPNGADVIIGRISLSRILSS